MVRYGLSNDSYFAWGDEGTPYDKAAAIAKQFGLISEDVRPPNPNPHTGIPSAGAKRGPHVWARDEQEYGFDLPFEVQHADAPFHVALGKKTVTAEDPDATPATGDEYTKTLFTEENILPTITVEYGQQTLDILQHYIGTKASLAVSAAKGQSLKATMGLLAAKEEHDVTAPSFANAPVVPTDEPIRFSDIVRVELLNSDTQALIKDVLTLDSLDFNWNPGLSVNHHGQSGRQGYSVSEEAQADLYDMKIGVTLDGSDYFKRAADNEAAVDLEVEFARQVGTGGVTIDGAIFRLKECKVLDAPTPKPAAGRLMTDIPLGPRSTEIELRTPA